MVFLASHYDLLVIKAPCELSLDNGDDCDAESKEENAGDDDNDDGEDGVDEDDDDADEDNDD